MKDEAAQKGRQLETGNIIGLIARFSLPMIAAMIVNALYQLVDRAFVGHLPGTMGQAGMAAVTVCYPLTVLIFAASMLAGAGGAANISLCLGRKDEEAAKKFTGTGLASGIILTAAVAVPILLFMDWLLTSFGAGKTDLPFARIYLTIIIAGSPLNAAGFCLNRYILARGYVGLSLTAGIIGLVVNCALNALFIFVYGWGVAGAAAGTVFAQLAVLIWCIACFIRVKMPAKMGWRHLKPDIRIFLAIAALGLAPFLLQITMAAGQFVQNRVLSGYGEAAVAVFGAVVAVAQLLMMPAYGINQGVAPVIGYNHGAGLTLRVRHLLVGAVVASVAATTVIWAAAFMLPGHIAAVFGAENAEMMRRIPSALRIYIALLPLFGFQTVVSNYFFAVDRPVRSLILCVSRPLLLIPAALVLPAFYKESGVFLSGPVADALSFAPALILFIVEMIRLRKAGKNADRSK